MSRSVKADRIEQFVVDQIRRIGADPELQRATFEQAVAQVKAQRRGLKLESKRLESELTTARAEIERLVATLSRVTGSASDAVQTELARVQDRVATLEARQQKVAAELEMLKGQSIDPTDVAQALEQFDPIWEILIQPERERVLQLLVERIDFRGDTGELTIHWRLAGLGDFTTEVDGGRQ